MTTYRSRPRRGWLALATSLVALAPLLTASLAVAQSLDRINAELSDMEGRLDAAEREPLTVETRRDANYLERRLTDGELYFRLQDYLRASIIFTNIVENYPGTQSYPDALYYLGESLYQAGDLLGARTRFRSLLERAEEPGFGPYVQRTLGRLIEIAIRLRDFDGVEGYFQALSRLPSTEVEATNAYYRAKYLYNRAVPSEEDLREAGEGAPVPTIDTTRLEEARRAFEAVPEGSPFYPQARYFIGVVHTLRAEFPQAIEAFRRVLRAEASTREQRDVVDLTQLALGRLYYETEQVEQAIEAYQGVPRTSQHIDTALYEISWAYIRLGDSTRAERALEVLAVATPDSSYIPDAQVLRGNLLLRNGRFDDSERVFREVREEFGPIDAELREVRDQHEDIDAYFRGLVRDNMEDFDIDDFLPATARRYVDLEGDFDRAVGVLSDLSTARRLVAETDDLVLRLSAALQASNRVSVFGDLRRSREATTALRNRLVRVRGQLIEYEQRNLPATGPELTAVRAERRRIEQSMGGMPTSDEDFAVRDDELLGRYSTMTRELQRLEVDVQGLEARIVATELYLTQAEAAAAEAGESPPEQATQSVRSELANQRLAVDRYRERIAELTRLVEVARLQVGVGDNRYQTDERRRTEYAALVERERRLSGASGSPAEPAFRRVASLDRRLDVLDARIEGAVEERVAQMTTVIDDERQRLTGYRQALADLEGETEVVVGAVTSQAFDDVRDRFYQLVLESDVGGIDVSWQRREEHRSRMDMLNRERARELQVLDDEFRDITDDREDQ
ncbi:MAG: tetratricopeptide repeat protein [Myxococcota bacterium]